MWTRKYTNLIGRGDSGRQQSDSAPPINLLLLAAAKILMCQAVDSLQTNHSLSTDQTTNRQSHCIAPSLDPLLLLYLRFYQLLSICKLQPETPPQPPPETSPSSSFADKIDTILVTHLYPVPSSTLHSPYSFRNGHSFVFLTFCATSARHWLYGQITKYTCTGLTTTRLR